MNPSDLDRLALTEIVKWMSPFQSRYFADRSKFKICLKARQLGISEMSVAEMVLHCGQHANHTAYLIKQTVTSASNELLQRAKDRWIPAFQQVPSLAESLKVVKSNANEVVFANGSRLAAAACDPQRLRGEVASFVFDEIDFLDRRHLETLPDAIFPTIMNPLNPHCLLRFVSTPWIEGRLFHDVWTNKGDQYGDWSRHKISIWDAIKDGWPIDPEPLKKRYRSTPERFDREYDCKWVSTDYYMFQKEILETLSVKNPEYGSGSKIVAGVDVGKIHDFTSVLIAWKDGDVITTSDLYLIRKLSYERIAKIVTELFAKCGVTQVFVDCTNNEAFTDSLKAKTDVLYRELNKGFKVPPKEILIDQWWEPKRKYPAPNIKGINFTNPWKQEQVERLMTRIETSTIRFDFDKVHEWDDEAERFIKREDPLMLNDLSRLIQGSTPQGKPSYEVERSVEDGHGDSFASLMLVLDALSKGPFTFRIS